MNTKFTLVSAWFATSFLSLIFSIVSLLAFSTDKVIIPKTKDFRLYASLPSSNSEITDEVIKKDARAKIVEDFFRKYKAPLADYADYFVIASEQYNLDYRLLPAIAMQESNGGKRVIPDSYNPFGYGIYGSLVTRFDSWESAIERVARGLREDYLNKGLQTPYEIMTKYTPPSLAKGGPWAINVGTFMEEMQ